MTLLNQMETSEVRDNLGSQIRFLSREHLLKNNGILAGQCLTAVGWVAGTVPELTEDEGIVELSMADVAGGGIVAGYALAQRRPIYVVRYQGFLWYNLVTIANYCAKSSFLWGISCPVWVRAICMEGAIGPVAGNGHHSMAARMPGMRVIAPGNSKEYTSYFNEYLSCDDVFLVSEHRRLFTNTIDIEDKVHDGNVAILAVSATRIEASQASVALTQEGFNCDYFGITSLSPLQLPQKFVDNISRYNLVLVLDIDYAFCSVSSQIELEVLKLNRAVKTINMALPKKIAGFSSMHDLRTPTTQDIIHVIKAHASRN